MGLDMYLERGDKIGNYTQKDYNNVIQEFKDYKTTEIAYWRKFNALHKWFVDNVQNGEDEGEYYPVNKEDLLTLLSLLKKVTKNNADKLLPTQSGFFFGSTDYDEWYFENVANSILELTEILDTFDFDKYMLFYGASW